MAKILKKIKVEYIQILFLFILIYEMIIKRTFKYDNILIISIIGATLYRNKKIYFDKDSKKLYALIIINTAIFLLSYYKVLKLNNFILDERFDMLNSIVFKGFLLFLIGLNLNIGYEKTRYIVPFVCVASISPLIKITNFGLKYGFFRHRISGMWGNPNYVGFVLGLITIFCVIAIVCFQERLAKIIGVIFGSWSFFLLLAVSQSRNAILSVLVSLVVLFSVYSLKLKINKKKFFSIVFLFSGLIAIVLKLNQRFKSLFFIDDLLKDGRTQILKITLEILKGNNDIALGKGFSFYFNNLSIGYEKLSSFHNDYIEILINQGVMGIFFYLLLSFYILYLIIKNIKYNTFESNTFSILALLLWIYIFILGQFDNVIYSNRVFEMAYLIFGLSIGENYKNDKKDKKIL